MTNMQMIGVITIETENRMKEITGNLRRDVKDLLGESANLVTGFFKRGACTVRAVADKWKAFARDISNAVDTLMEPPFAGDGPEAPAQELNPAAEPVVTVMESGDSRFPVGMKLPLSQANELVGKADMEQAGAGHLPMPVQLKIDYTKDGCTDRYWLPLEIGAGGDLLTQMQKHINRYVFTIQVGGNHRLVAVPQQALGKLNADGVSLFRRHLARGIGMDQVVAQNAARFPPAPLGVPHILEGAGQLAV